MPKQKFEFRVFPADANGRFLQDKEFTLEEEWQDRTAARNRAGRLAKQNNGPVDLAEAYVPGEIGQDWNDRYVTTARPSQYTKTGFEFERLDG